MARYGINTEILIFLNTKGYVSLLEHP